MKKKKNPMKSLKVQSCHHHYKLLSYSHHVHVMKFDVYFWQCAIYFPLLESHLLGFQVKPGQHLNPR